MSAAPTRTYTDGQVVPTAYITTKMIAGGIAMVRNWTIRSCRLWSPDGDESVAIKDFVETEEEAREAFTNARTMRLISLEAQINKLKAKKVRFYEWTDLWHKRSC